MGILEWTLSTSITFNIILIMRYIKLHKKHKQIETERNNLHQSTLELSITCLELLNELSERDDDVKQD